jgi:pimeloyl-ACP methyl ester carboxylesterase
VKQALVLVPGLASDAVCWQHQLDHLTDRVEIAVADFRACSSRAEMVEAVLRTAPPRFALAGQSMGGWVGMELAARAPERVVKLALLATWTNPDPAFNEEQRAAIHRIRAGQFDQVCRDHSRLILLPSHRQDEQLVSTIEAMLQRAGPEVMTRQIQAMIDDYGSRALLPKIRCPTLVLAARQDPLFSVPEHEAIAAGIPGSKLVVVEDSGHAVHMEQPQAVTALLRFWLDHF